MRNWLENTAAILTVSALAGLAIAQQQRTAAKMPAHTPANSKFSIQIDVNAIKQTKLGGMLFELAKQKAIEEVSKHGGKEEGMEKITKMLGMDPFEEIQTITLSSADFEEPDKSMLAVVQLKKTSGNLEGLALGMPGYQASEYKKHQIHSSAAENKFRVFGAIHGKEDQNRTIVITPNKSTLESILDELDSGNNTASDASQSPLVRVQLFEMPIDKIGDGPQANIAKIVKSFMMDVEDDEDEIAFTANMATETEKQAEQLRQMAQGLIAMIDFAQAMDSDDKDLKKVREMLVGLQATREGTDVQVGLKLNANKIAAAIADELGIELEVDRAKLEEQKKLAEAQAELAKAQAELAKAQKAVDERVKKWKDKYEETEKQLKKAK